MDAKLMNGAELDFWVADEQPRGRGRVPQMRLNMIEFARERAGEWIAYRPNPDRDGASVRTLRGYAIKGVRGFEGSRWETHVEEDQLHVRYLGVRDRATRNCAIEDPQPGGRHANGVPAE